MVAYEILRGPREDCSRSVYREKTTQHWLTIKFSYVSSDPWMDRGLVISFCHGKRSKVVEVPEEMTPC